MLYVKFHSLTLLKEMTRMIDNVRRYHTSISAVTTGHELYNSVRMKSTWQMSDLMLRPAAVHNTDWLPSLPTTVSPVCDEALPTSTDCRRPMYTQHTTMYRQMMSTYRDAAINRSCNVSQTDRQTAIIQTMYYTIPRRHSNTNKHFI